MDHTNTLYQPSRLQPEPQTNGCSLFKFCRSTVKTLVLLYSCCCITILIWLAITRNNYLSQRELEESKFLIISLYIDTPVSMTLTVLLFYIDHAGQGLGQPGAINAEKSRKSVRDFPTSDSASSRTVMTIDSGNINTKNERLASPEQQVQQLPPPPLVFSTNLPTPKADTFVNFTPGKSKPVTIVDNKRNDLNTLAFGKNTP